MGMFDDLVPQGASGGMFDDLVPQSGPGTEFAASVALPDVNLARAKGESLPGWQKPIQAAQDLLSLGASGISFGFADEALAKADEVLRGQDYEQALAKRRGETQDARDRAGLPGMAAEIVGSMVPAVKAAQMGVTATRLPGAAGKYLGLTADGAALGALTAAGNDQDIGQGAALGGMFGAVGQGVTSLASRAVSPFRIDPERAKMADVLKREGVDLTAGQKTGSQKLRYAESELGGAAAEEFTERQGEQFTKAALSRVGEDASRATPEVIDKAFSRIGNEFDRLSGSTAIIPDTQAAADLTQIAVDYASTVAPSMRIPLIEKSVTDMINLMQTGRVSGDVYKTFRSQLSKFTRTASQPEARQSANDVIAALDDAMERSIARTNPAILGEWKKARRQYRNMLVIERSVTGAGEKAAAGMISPAQLRNATVTKQGRRNYARGTGDFADLARAGEAVMRDLPNSGTASRLAARGVPNLLGAGVGAAYGGGEGGSMQDILTGAAAGFALPYAAGRGLLSGPGRAYLGNQAATKMTPQMQESLVRALMAAGVYGTSQK